MNIRESLEQWEKEYLSPYAMLSMHSQGRLKPEEQCFRGTGIELYIASPSVA